MRHLAALLGLLAFALAACSQRPLPATPALWEVTDTAGHNGWLFGTIHSAPAPLAWRSSSVDAALEKAGTVMVEVGNLRDDAAVSATFARLAKGHDEPPLSQRIDAAERPALARLLEKIGYGDDQFADVETWAAALTLARNADEDANADNGVDRAILAAAGDRPVIELEGAERQLGIFDALPETEQRDLLTQVVREASRAEDAADANLVDSWRKGDTRAIAAQTRKGLLSDPELRLALYTQRNTDWLARIEAAIGRDERPFVAVGAAHMAGEDGLVALLARAGFTVKRLQ